MTANRLLLFLCLFLCASPHTQAQTRQLTVRIDHVFGDKTLPFDDVSLRTSGGNTISVSRLSYLLSNITLFRESEPPLRLDTLAFIDAPGGRTSFQLPPVPSGRYKGIAFDIGLDPVLNHSDPTRYPAGYPLNPNLNALHWSWQGGYVFLAIEGRYVLPADQLGGYSYHIATDAHLMHAELARDFSIDRDCTLDLSMDVARVFSSGATITIRHAFGEDSTHSAEGDALAARIAANIPSAFSIHGTSESTGETRVRPVASEPPPGTHRYFFQTPRGFSDPELPPDNPLTIEGVRLGERLFSERKLSINDTQSCADCHVPSQAFSDAGHAYSKGALGEPGRRNTMPLFNLAWAGSMTWDGKRARIRDQALAPIADAREMNQSLDAGISKLESDGTYPAAFRQAFGSPGITADRIGLALEQYLLTLVAADSKFDLAMRSEAEFTEEEMRGLSLFVQEFDPVRGRLGADCFHCHGNELFTNQLFANNGLDSVFADPGRASVTGRPADAGRFKVPSLRNVELTGPYMHDGRFATLEEVVDHYADGVQPSDSLDPNIAKHPEGGLALSCEDRKAIVAFLKTLTDSRYRPVP
ncbi:MAG: MbnP family protein [Phycisphaerales bacterium]|nr:cytochrome C peroxidase [Planctomycetota bacterium]